MHDFTQLSSLWSPPSDLALPDGPHLFSGWTVCTADRPVWHLTTPSPSLWQHAAVRQVNVASWNMFCWLAAWFPKVTGNLAWSDQNTLLLFASVASWGAQALRRWCPFWRFMMACVLHGRILFCVYRCGGELCLLTAVVRCVPATMQSLSSTAGILYNRIDFCKPSTFVPVQQMFPLLQNAVRLAASPLSRTDFCTGQHCHFGKCTSYLPCLVILWTLWWNTHIIYSWTIGPSRLS